MKNLSDILDAVNHISFNGKREGSIDKVVQLGGDIDQSSLFWCGDKFKEELLKVSKGVAIVSQETDEFLKSKGHKLDRIVVENPRRSFAIVLRKFFIEKPNYGEIHPSAYIAKNVSIDKNTVALGANVILEEEVVIGANVSIDHNTVIKKGTVIESNVNIGSNCTIGGVGFGYEPDESGNYELMPHIGNVHISKNVEIGNNTTIDRAVMGSTLIGENVKIDNLVHIAHGVEIGKNSLIIANAMVAGSVKIGEGVWVSPSTSIIQKAKIGDNALVGMGSIVLKDVESNAIVAGVPAKKIKDRK